MEGATPVLTTTSSRLPVASTLETTFEGRLLPVALERRLDVREEVSARHHGDRIFDRALSFFEKRDGRGQETAQKVKVYVVLDICPPEWPRRSTALICVLIVAVEVEAVAITAITISLSNRLMRRQTDI